MKLALALTDTLELESIVFCHSGEEKPRAAYRSQFGWIHERFSSVSSIPWSAAVKAMSILLVKTAAFPNGFACLRGNHNSAASSLDYSLGKEPNWMKDLFGTDSKGRSFAQRVFRRMNPDGKRQNPFLVCVNSKVLAGERIKIIIGEQPVHEPLELLAVASFIEQAQWPNEPTTSPTDPFASSLLALGLAA